MKIGWVCNIHQTAGFFVGKKIGNPKGCLECLILETDNFKKDIAELNDHQCGYNGFSDEQKLAYITGRE